MKGINRASAPIRMFTEHNNKDKKCVFLSHKSEDKDACIKIGEYLNNVGIDTYLDINDDQLQTAWHNHDIETMTNCIKQGLDNSSHILCIVSQNTINSKWVPFEIGYAHAVIIDNSLNKVTRRYQVSLLKLENIADRKLPEYLQIVPNIEGAKSFDEYICNVLGTHEHQFINESTNLRLFSKQNHPLYNILNLSK